MLRAFAIAAIAAATVLAARPGSAVADGLIVVELFTSQGCSSCPPADKLLGELAERNDVLALALHVDYWDYIGWKDPFAQARHTERQRSYSTHFGLGYVYTPQVVVNGAWQATGSDRDRVMDGIAGADAARYVEVALRPAGSGEIEVALGGAAEGTTATVWLVMYDHEHVTTVAAGENTGMTMTNVNVVRTMEQIGTWDGTPMTIRTAVTRTNGARGSCAVLVQSATDGRVLGAARMALGTN